MSDMVNHPAHYTAHPSGIECIEITRHMNFNIGNAIKYLWRAGIKGRHKPIKLDDALSIRDVQAILDEARDGKRKHIEDLKKAVWYINDEIKQLEKGR